MPWAPGDAWPGTVGGASSPHWGGYVRLYVYLAISAGQTMQWGIVAGTNDQLDSGNVWATTVPAGPAPPTPPTGQLWVDVSCDVRSVKTTFGGGRADGAIARGEAATCSISLQDPDRIYDPLNPASPWQYRGRTRLGPRTGVHVFAEVVNATTSVVTRFALFTGTVDTWTEPWDPEPKRRRANVVASDDTKTLVSMDRGEQAPAGADDTVHARIERILTYYGWTGTRVLGTSSVTLQSTTMAQSAWQLIGRATDDEIGFVYLDTSGVLRFHPRSVWATTPAEVAVVGCSPEFPAALDIVTDVTVTAIDTDELKNAVYAARTGGVTQSARSETSITLWGEHGFKRTDLGLASDAQASVWAEYILTLYGWPRARIDTVTLVPKLAPQEWATVLGVDLITESVRVVWTPPDAPDTTYDATARVFGITHDITYAAWQVDWELALADLFARVMRWGPHEFAQLDANNVYA